LATAAVGGMPPMVDLAVTQTLHRGAGGIISVVFNSAGHLFAFALVARFVFFQQIPKCAISSILFMEFAPLLINLPQTLRYLSSEALPHETMRSVILNPSRMIRSLFASDLSIYVAALLCPLFLGVIRGSVTAIVLELAVAVARFAGPGAAYLGRVPGERLDVYEEIGVDGSAAVSIAGINIVQLSGSRWFGNTAATTRFLRRERRASDVPVYCAVVDMRMVAFLDETALAFYKREWSSPNLGIKLFVTNCSAHVRQQMRKSGLLAIFDQPERSLVDMHTAVQLAEAHVLEIHRSQTALLIGRSSDQR